MEEKGHGELEFYLMSEKRSEKHSCQLIKNQFRDTQTS